MLFLRSGDNEDVTDDVWQMDFKEIRRVAKDALDQYEWVKGYTLKPTIKNKTDDTPPSYYLSCEFELKKPSHRIRIDQPYVATIDSHHIPKSGRISTSFGSRRVENFNYRHMHQVVSSYIAELCLYISPEAKQRRREIKKRDEMERRLMKALRHSIQQATVDQFVIQVCEGAYDAIVEDHENTPDDLSLKELLEVPLIEIIANSPGWNSNYEPSPG